MNNPTKREMVSMFAAGDEVTVTNYYISRPDHPCYGTRSEKVARVSAGGITFEGGGRVPWPKVDDMASPTPGQLILYSRPDGEPGPFLEILAT